MAVFLGNPDRVCSSFSTVKLHDQFFVKHFRKLTL